MVGLVDISAPFYVVQRGYRGKLRYLYAGNDAALADAIYRRVYAKLHSGAILMFEDGKPIRHFHGGYNRTRW